MVFETACSVSRLDVQITNLIYDIQLAVLFISPLYRHNYCHMCAVQIV